MTFITAPFRALGAFLVVLAEAGPRLEAIRRLSRLSDDELAARGTSRQDEVRRIIGASAHL